MTKNLSNQKHKIHNPLSLTERILKGFERKHINGYSCMNIQTETQFVAPTNLLVVISVPSYNPSCTFVHLIGLNKLTLLIAI